MPVKDDPNPAKEVDEWLQNHRAMTPPAAFAESVVAKALQEGILSGVDDESLSNSTQAPVPWRRKPWLIPIAASLFLLLGNQLHLPVAVSSHEAKRAQFSLGNRGILVAEANAIVNAEVDWLGNAHVEQKRGRVFYRVEKGRSFEVHTPHGTVFVTGTSFVVDVKKAAPVPHFSNTSQVSAAPKHLSDGKTMAQTQLPISSRSSLAMAAGGILAGTLTTLLAVHVLEGEVIVSTTDPKNTLRIRAGQEANIDKSGRISSREASEPNDVKTLLAEREHFKGLAAKLQTQLENRIAVDVNGPASLENENEKLRLKLAHLEREQELVEEERLQKEGTPIAFPDDLPEAFEEKRLQEMFMKTLREMGIRGEVKAIDCSEFPCVVWGEMEPADNDKGEGDSMRKFAKRLKEKMPEGTSWSKGVWRSRQNRDDGTQVDRNIFSMSPFPNEEDEEQLRNIKTRLRLRNRQFMESEMQ